MQLARGLNPSQGFEPEAINRSVVSGTAFSGARKWHVGLTMVGDAGIKGGSRQLQLIPSMFWVDPIQPPYASSSASSASPAT